MAYSEYLTDRIRLLLSSKRLSVEEKKMMGGLTFMVNDKMCVGVVKDDLMVRLDPVIYEMALTKKGCREMDLTHKPMKGFVFVNQDGTSSQKELEYWLNLCIEYNSKAKSSKKKTK